MKKFFLLLALSLATHAALMAQNNIPQPTEAERLAMMQGIGPAISGSVNYDKLPEKARKFIQDYFSDQQIVKLEKDYAPERYVVKFKNGTEAEFDTKGLPVEVETDKGSTLGTGVLKEMLPEPAFVYLVEQGLINSVEKIEHSGRKYETEFIKGQKLSKIEFNKDGTVKRQK